MSFVSWYMAEPHEDHQAVVKRILRHAAGTLELSYPNPRRWNRSFYTCAQDVQITHSYNMTNKCNVR
jgi:hypothetical protein